MSAPPNCRFTGDGVTCAAWSLRGEGDRYLTGSGRPCVVIAHGLAGTRDFGLRPYARPFALAGLDVLLFDYRCFGDSAGEPRQLGPPARHRADYRADHRAAVERRHLSPGPLACTAAPAGSAAAA